MILFSELVKTGAILLLAAAPAEGADPSSVPSDGSPVVDAQQQQSRDQTSVERPFLFVDDPALPAPGEVVLTGGLGNVTRSGEARPVGSGTVMPSLSGEVGILRRVSAFTDVNADFPRAGETGISPVGFTAGARVAVVDALDHTLKLDLAPQVGRDFSTAFLAAMDATASWDYSRLRVAANLRASHEFRAGADGVDLSAAVAATVDVGLDVRLGVEGVSQDLEELEDAMAEGGTAAFAGPTVGWEWDRRFEVVAGPMVGVVPGIEGVSLSGRVGASLFF